MSADITRRKVVEGSIAAVAGASALGAAIAAARFVPHNRGGLLGIGEALTYSAQRLITSNQALAREFDKTQISQVAPVNGLPPVDETYRNLAANGFKDWRLTIDGMVDRPMSLSLDELKAMPSESHTILHACEEGWSYIAEWTGVRLSHVLERVGTQGQARYAVFTPFENVNQNTGARRVLWDGIDMADALHPQTILAYAMNGEDLSLGHGAPVRLRMSRQLGYKNTKYLLRITLTDNPDKARDPTRRGTWYGGI